MTFIPDQAQDQDPATFSNEAQSWFVDPSQPTQDELVAYVKDLAEDNPSAAASRNVVRDLLRDLTGITDPWEKTSQNGTLGITWSEFKVLCGLGKTRAQRKLMNQASKHASVDYLRTPSEERLSYGSLYVKPDNGQRFKTILGAGDFHDIEVDEFALRMFVEKARAAQPDVITIHGDLFDAPEFSKHFQDPREFDLQTRMDKAHDILRQLREAAPNAQIDLIEGNHEARIARHTLENSAAIAVLLERQGIDIRQLMGLDQFNVNYVAKGSLAAFTDAQMKKSVLESERVYWNTVWVRHHPPTQKNVSMTGFHGHHHQHQVTTHWNTDRGSFEWHQLGCMHRRQAGYTDGRKWNLGFIFGVVDTEMERVVWDYTYVGDTCCVMGGQFYERRPHEYYPALMADLDNRPSNRFHARNNASSR